MNSSELQKNHAKIYENFFASNLLVVSAPFLINRSGDVHPDFSGVSIKQKIPLRLYVGIEKNKQGQNMIGTIYSYDYENDEFETQEGEHYASYGNALLKEINKHIPSNVSGVTFNILSEVPRTLGLGYNSILSLCVSAILAILADDSITENLIAMPKSIICDALYRSDILHNILCSSMELDVAINGKMGVSLKISTFFDSYYPIVSFKGRSSHIIESRELKSIHFYGLRMNEMWEDVQETSFPFDFGIIVSDKPVLRENLKNTHDTPPISDEEKSHIKTVFDNIIPLDQRICDIAPKFYQFLEKNEVLYNTYGAMMGAISIETLNMFSKVLSSHYNDEMLTNFFLTMNKIRYGNNIVRKSSHYFLSFIDQLLSAVNLSSCEFAVFPNDTLIMGGTLTYVSYSAKNRHAIQSGVEKIRNNRSGVKIIYSNATDGIAQRGFMIEQFIEKGIVSKHLQNHSRLLEDNTGKKTVGEFSYLINNPEYDLIFDRFNGKIYHKGHKLTSHDLSSQSTTIELIYMLLYSENNEISNIHMPSSSYSKNKNELNSKIISPLERRVKKEIGKDCIIKATGSLTAFNVYMKYNTLKIAFLNKKKISE